MPAPILKLFWLVPSVQITAPVLWSTLYTPQVFRIDTIRLPSLSSEIEFRWYGSYTNPGAPFLKNDWVIGMWSSACHSNRTSPVLMSISWMTESISGRPIPA